MGISASKFGHASNDYELAIRSSKELEHFLEVEFGATGKGLHEKITSSSGFLTPSLVKDMRYLATIRNKLIHEVRFDAIPNRTVFIEKFEKSKQELRHICKERGNEHSCIIS